MTVPKTTTNEIYISLGSNIKPRFEHLKSACKLIKTEVGEITQYSKIYETPAWGFVSTPFLNACICITTYLDTKEVLKNIRYFITTHKNCCLNVRIILRLLKVTMFLTKANC